MKADQMTVSAPRTVRPPARAASGDAGIRLLRWPVALRWAAGAAALGAVALPPRALAVALVGDGSAVLADVVLGAWIFKLLLFVHAAALLAATNLRLKGGSAALASDAVVRTEASTRALQGLLVALVLGGALLRLIGLNAGLWFDEIRTLVGYAHLPFGQIVATYDSQNQHVLYSLLAHAAVSTFGDGAWALRLPAVLFGVASLGALYWFGSLITTKREALLATALLTVSYHHIWFSQDARGYTALLFFTLVASGILLKQLVARDVLGWAPVGYALAMALAVFTHVTAALIVIAHALVWIVLTWRAKKQSVGAQGWLPLVGFALAGTLALQLYALALPQFMRTLFTPTMAGVATAWKSPLWFIAETIRGLNSGIPGGLAVVLAASLVGVAGIVSYTRQSRTIAALMVLPGLLTAAAVLIMEHNLWPRFFFFCAGFAVLIAVRGVFAVCQIIGERGSAVATVAVGAVTLASCLTVPRAWLPKQDYAGALDYVQKSRAASDAVVTVDLATYPYAQYLRAGWSAASSEAELAAIEASHTRTWVLYTFPARLSALQPQMWTRLERDYRTAGEFAGTVGGGAIIVKVRP